jgi:uncharacterized protein YcbK (DUF882 family)
MQKHNRSRRLFLKKAGLAAPALALPIMALPTMAIPVAGLAAERSPYRLRLYHQHTREELDIVYRDGYRYRHDALEKISWLLRDFRSGEIYPIDRRLLNLLHQIQRYTGSVSAYEIISGFRSPKTNTMLRKHTSGVAARSLHMKGRAIDVRLTDLPTRDLREAALDIGRGGVGYYPKSNFVHLDTGRTRSW